MTPDERIDQLTRLVLQLAETVSRFTEENEEITKAVKVLYKECTKCLRSYDRRMGDVEYLLDEHHITEPAPHLYKTGFWQWIEFDDPVKYKELLAEFEKAKKETEKDE
jgi:hypothetical protein